MIIWDFCLEKLQKKLELTGDPVYNRQAPANTRHMRRYGTSVNTSLSVLHLK